LGTQGGGGEEEEEEEGRKVYPGANALNEEDSGERDRATQARG